MNNRIEQFFKFRFYFYNGNSKKRTSQIAKVIWFINVNKNCSHQIDGNEEIVCENRATNFIQIKWAEDCFWWKRKIVFFFGKLAWIHPFTFNSFNKQFFFRYSASCTFTHEKIKTRKKNVNGFYSSIKPSIFIHIYCVQFVGKLIKTIRRWWCWLWICW